MRTWTRAAWAAACLIAAMAWAPMAFADIYMYSDSRGGLHFSNAPTEPQYRYYTHDLASWHKFKAWGVGRIDGARRKQFDQIIAAAARRHQVDAALIKAVIRTESDFVPEAVSPKGALGLMQLMPATARLHNVGRAFEPGANVEGGVRHLRYLLDRYSGNLRLTLAAYNAGEKAVERSGGVPPYPETWQYLTRVLQFRDQYLREQ